MPVLESVESALVGVGNVLSLPYFWPKVTDLEVVETVPPLGLNVTLYVFAIQTEYKVVSAVIEAVAPELYLVPVPSVFVFQEQV